MGSMIRATNLWGYVDLVRELGGKPERFLARFDIPAGHRARGRRVRPFGPFAHMLEASADELSCPDFGLRLSRWQGLDILGPIAVIARNAVTLEEGLASIARYLYVHSPAFISRGAAARVPTRFAYEVTELSLQELRQGYELSMANGARIIRLLGGPDARPTRSRSCTTSSVRMRPMPRRSAVPCASASPGVASSCPRTWPTDPRHADAETRRIATKYLESSYLPSTAALSERVAELTRRLLPTGHCTADDDRRPAGTAPADAAAAARGRGTRFQDVIDRERRARRRATSPSRCCSWARSPACWATRSRARSTARAGAGSA